MKHYTSSDFWLLYEQLPVDIQKLADKNYQLLKDNPRHPSLRLKRIEELWSVRVGKVTALLALMPLTASNGFG